MYHCGEDQHHHSKKDPSQPFVELFGAAHEIKADCKPDETRERANCMQPMWQWWPHAVHYHVKDARHNQVQDRNGQCQRLRDTDTFIPLASVVGINDQNYAAVPKRGDRCVKQTDESHCAAACVCVWFDEPCSTVRQKCNSTVMKLFVRAHEVFWFGCVRFGAKMDTHPAMTVTGHCHSIVSNVIKHKCTMSNLFSELGTTIMSVRIHKGSCFKLSCLCQSPRSGSKQMLFGGRT
jgi:hypothetical protein